MTLRELAEALRWDVQCKGSSSEARVQGAYCGDLLSHALATTKPGDVWITIQHHGNIVAVAQVTGAAGVVLAGGVRASDSVVERAEAAGVAIFSSADSTFDLCARVHRALAEGC